MDEPVKSKIFKALTNPNIKKAETKASSFPFPRLGVRINVFRCFIKNAGKENLIGLTTTEVCLKYLLPATQDDQLAYCDLLQAKGSDEVGDATLFISHAWKFPFLDVVSTIEAYIQRMKLDNNDTYIWFDLFSNNQNIAVDLDFDWWCGTFRTAIENIGHVVLILAPWEDPIPFQRAWCLFEIYIAIDTKAIFHIALSPAEEENFQQKICENDGAYFNMISSIDVRRSESFNPVDKEGIFEVVKTLENGFDGVNQIIIGKMRDWVCDSLRFAIEHSMGVLSELLLEKALALGQLLYKQSKYDEALQILNTMINECKGNNDFNVYIGMYYNEIANVYYGIRNFKDALIFYEKALPILLQTVDPSAEIIGKIYNSIAIIYRNTDQFELAREYYEKALQIFIQHHGEENEDVAMIYHGISIMHLFMGDPGKALEIDNIALDLFVKTIGPTHTTTARVYNNKGNIYKKMKKYDESIESFKKALAIKKQALGPEHHAVATTLNNMAEVYLHQEMFDEFLELANEEYRIKVAALGVNHEQTLSTKSLIEYVKAKRRA